MFLLYAFVFRNVYKFEMCFSFMTDTEAWQELAELYTIENDLPKAAFCIEELILHNPHNHLLHQRYADIRYTQGGLENVELAKSYYCQTLKLNPHNMRALYGLYLVLHLDVLGLFVFLMSGNILDGKLCRDVSKMQCTKEKGGDEIVRMDFVGDKAEVWGEEGVRIGGNVWSITNKLMG